MQQGFLPPNDTSIEEIILGAILLDKTGYERISDLIRPDTFYNEKYGKIYAAIQRIAKKNNPIDGMTVINELKLSGELEYVGGPYAISILTNKISSAESIEFHAKIISEKFIQREIARIGTKAVNSSYDQTTDVFDLMSSFQHDMEMLTKSFHVAKTKTTTEIVSNVLESIKQAKINKGVLGPSTGLKVLDEVLRGLRKTNVYVIAGRPAMGKSAFIVSLAKALCVEQNIPIALFSLEMSSEQIIHRLLSDLSDIDNNKLSSGYLAEFQEAALRVAAARIKDNFYIDDTSSITIQYLENKVRKLVTQGVEYIIIDYLQLMTLTETDKKGKSVEQEVSYLTSNLKRIAKKYEIGVIELSQLSRKCEDREVPRPILSDLHSSGTLEANADVVILLYRPEYYNIEFGPKGARYPTGYTELIIAKHRGGETKGVDVRYKGEYTRFEDLPTEKTETMEDIEQQPKIIM